MVVVTRSLHVFIGSGKKSISHRLTVIGFSDVYAWLDTTPALTEQETRPHEWNFLWGQIFSNIYANKYGRYRARWDA